MIIAMCCNENWYKYLVVNIYSLLHFTKNVKKIYLLCETDNIDDIKYLSDIKNKYNIDIQIINFNKVEIKYINNDCPNVDSIYTKFTLGRLMLADLIEEDKVLYLDTDTIVRKDISSIWNYDINDYYLAGCKDFGALKMLQMNNKLDNIKNYVNAGVALFNLKKIKEDNIVEKCFNILNKYELKYPDQDSINTVCHNKILFLPSTYNCAIYSGEDDYENNVYYLTREPINKDLVKIYHYTGPKKDWVVDKPHFEEWYDSYEMFLNDIVNKEN